MPRYPPMGLVDIIDSWSSQTYTREAVFFFWSVLSLWNASTLYKGTKLFWTSCKTYCFLLIFTQYLTKMSPPSFQCIQGLLDTFAILMTNAPIYSWFQQGCAWIFTQRGLTRSNWKQLGLLQAMHWWSCAWLLWVTMLDKVADKAYVDNSLA